MKRVLTGDDKALITRLTSIANNQHLRFLRPDEARATVALIQRLAHGEMSSE